VSSLKLGGCSEIITPLASNTLFAFKAVLVSNVFCELKFNPPATTPIMFELLS
jgi:hypothetical protein